MAKTKAIQEVEENLNFKEETNDPKEQARSYVEQSIQKIEWTHIDKQAIRWIVEQVLTFF